MSFSQCGALSSVTTHRTFIFVSGHVHDMSEFKTTVIRFLYDSGTERVGGIVLCATRISRYVREKSSKLVLLYRSIIEPNIFGFWRRQSNFGAVIKQRFRVFIFVLRVKVSATHFNGLEDKYILLSA